MSSEDLSRITLWGINNGYEGNASNQAATIFNRQLAKKKTSLL
jgi:Mg/Co/Ni transporter MgtE